MPALRFLAVAFFILTLSGWGYLVHRTTAQLAMYSLPASLQRFFHQNKDYIVRHSVRPDIRRNEDKTEAPKHFIDLEAFGDSAAWKMPMDYAAAISRYSKDTVEKYGYVPYVVIATQEKLTGAFRKANRDSILFYAADLAHYIGDMNVPLHTSLNHDGQLTGQKGMHSLWESMIPEIELNSYDLSFRHNATYIANKEQAIWNAIRKAHSLLPEMFAEERAVSANFPDSLKYRVQMRNGRESRSYSTAFAKAYSQRLGNTINRQLIASSTLIADFWYTAWVDAGKPDMTQLMKAPFTKKEKKVLKSEQKAFKKNELIAKGLLVARKETGTIE